MRTKRPDDPFRRLVHMEQILWVVFTLLVPAAVVGAASLVLETSGEPMLHPDLAAAIMVAASAAVVVVSTLLGRSMTAPDRLDSVQYQLLPVRQAAYLHRVALMQLALADTAVMAGLLMALLATDLLPAILGAAAAVVHGLIHRPRLRGFLRERGRVEP